MAMQPRPAATLILLREGPEVLMLQRNQSAVFLGGAYVFPGGSLDAAVFGHERAGALAQVQRLEGFPRFRGALGRCLPPGVLRQQEGEPMLARHVLHVTLPARHARDAGALDLIALQLRDHDLARRHQRLSDRHQALDFKHGTQALVGLLSTAFRRGFEAFPRRAHLVLVDNPDLANQIEAALKGKIVPRSTGSDSGDEGDGGGDADEGAKPAARGARS